MAATWFTSPGRAPERELVDDHLRASTAGPSAPGVAAAAAPHPAGATAVRAGVGVHADGGESRGGRREDQGSTARGAHPGVVRRDVRRCLLDVETDDKVLGHAAPIGVSTLTT